MLLVDIYIANPTCYSRAKDCICFIVLWFFYSDTDTSTISRHSLETVLKKNKIWKKSPLQALLSPSLCTLKWPTGQDLLSFKFNKLKVQLLRQNWKRLNNLSFSKSIPCFKNIIISNQTFPCRMIQYLEMRLDSQSSFCLLLWFK